MSKKVLSLVLALVMVLGSFSFVSAAKYDDVTGTEFEKAVDRLSLLEILTGYPDGTFKPENTITRAEFAAVAVRAKGLADAADASKGLATGFTDVATDYWAAGYITTAGKLGIVNGVGNGLFAPGAPVKYEEAVTMMVRALGYEPAAQTKGGYPYGYLIVANEIGLLDGVKGIQGAPASRGIVAQITDNALEIPKMIQVGFGADAKYVVSGSKEHGTDAEAQLLLHDLGVEEYKGYVTNNFRTKSTVKENEIEIDGTKFKVTENVDTDAVLGAGVTAWAKDDVVFSVSVGFKFKRAGVDYEFDEDQIIYDRVVKKDTNEDEVYLYKLDDEYDWAKRARIFVNNEEVDVDEIPDRAYGRFILNEDDEVEFAYLFDFAGADTGLVTEIDDKDLEYINLNADEDVLALDDAEEIYVFNKDLSKASLEDIEENTAVFFWIDSDDNYYIVISNETVEGTLEAVRVRDSRITVDGQNFKFEQGNALLSVDEEDFEVLGNFEDVEDYVDEEVVVYLNLVGDTLALVTDADAVSSTVYGIATWLTSQRNPVLSVYTQEGKEVDYTFEDRDDIEKTGFDEAFNSGKPNGATAVTFKVNKDGEIKEGSLDFATTPHNFKKADNKKYGKYNGANLYITEDTVVLKAYNSSGSLKPSVIKYENIINKEIDENNEAIVILDKGNDLALLVFTNSAFQAVDDTEYGIVTSDPVVRGTTYRAEIDVFGKGKETYVISRVDDAKSLRTGDLIKFNLNDKGEVLVDDDKIDFRTDRDNPAVYEVVSGKDGNYVTTNKATTYRRTTDTIFYSATKSGSLGSASSYSRIDEDSILLLLANDGELKVVLDITAYRAGKADSGSGVETDGTVTYIDPAALTMTIEVTDKDGNFREYSRADGEISVAVANFLNANQNILEGAGMTFGFDVNGNINAVKAITINAVTGTPVWNITDGAAFNGLVIEGNDEEVGAVTVKANNVTIKNLVMASLVVEGDNFESKENHVKGTTDVYGKNAKFNTKLDGKVTVDATGASFANVVFGNDLEVKADADVAVTDAEFASDSNITGAGNVTLVGETKNLKPANISVTGTIDASKAKDEAIKEKADEINEANKDAEEAYQEAVAAATTKVEAAEDTLDALDAELAKDLTKAYNRMSLEDVIKNTVKKAYEAAKSLVDALDPADADLADRLADVKEAYEAAQLVLDKATAVAEIKPEFSVGEATEVTEDPEIDGLDFEEVTLYKAEVTLTLDGTSTRNVRINAGYDTDEVTTYVQDSKGTWFKNTDVWGPKEGFKAQTATTTVYFVVADGIEEVDFTISLVDVEWKDVVYGTEDLTVEVPESDE